MYYRHNTLCLQKIAKVTTNWTLTKMNDQGASTQSWDCLVALKLPLPVKRMNYLFGLEIISCLRQKFRFIMYSSRLLEMNLRSAPRCDLQIFSMWYAPMRIVQHSTVPIKSMSISCCVTRNLWNQFLGLNWTTQAIIAMRESSVMTL